MIRILIVGLLALSFSNNAFSQAYKFTCEWEGTIGSGSNSERRSVGNYKVEKNSKIAQWDYSLFINKNGKFVLDRHEPESTASVTWTVDKLIIQYKTELDKWASEIDSSSPQRYHVTYIDRNDLTSYTILVGNELKEEPLMSQCIMKKLKDRAF